ncbi:hypothetical protein PPSIR1_26923 [Plesiocystis pacifica SIR-1]|uniref:Tryptophan halogenase n=1 Tax=Plesiocystis pacifica SIR-1 TaxID=391625 RepID=A6GD88_9BACT|nr:tryptophan 7-halogenase [Plesiocystis pacifica]EDM76163.1 hypothetical protein PPSIR1_26923 [Plesiocystis pacifica SIR-1]
MRPPEAAPARAVEHLIVGAGVAGLTLRRFLELEGVSDSVAIVDPRPGSYKVGESVIPELFAHPELAALLPGIRALPSYTAKQGTTFVMHGRDGAPELAYFPVGARQVGEAMHVARDELEAEMARAWTLDIDRAAVTAIDWQTKRVETTAGAYQVSGLIFDCSGPAMVVAKSRGEVDERLPAWATWGYYDVVAEEPAALDRTVREAGWSTLEYDVRHRKIISTEGTAELAERIARSTYLSLVGDGLWTWQIPLFRGTRMSYGVVSRHGPVSPEQYREVVEATAAPHFQLRRRPEHGGSPYDRLHVRSGFARRARTPADKDFILIADAFGFSDPVYSVGTGLAVSQAIEVARMLAAGGWTLERCQAYCAHASRMLDRAQRAFEFWYAGAVVRDDAVAEEIQRDFLQGGLFQASVSEAYGTALDLASLDSERDPFDPDWEVVELLAPVTAFLELPGEGGAALVGWELTSARPCAGGLQLRWAGHGEPDMTMLVQHDPEGAGRAYKRVGELGLSYMRGEVEGPLDTNALNALFAAMMVKLRGREADWLALGAG